MTPLLVPTRRCVDQQANRGAQSDPGATLNPGRLSGRPRVTTFLKVTESRDWQKSLTPAPRKQSVSRQHLKRLPIMSGTGQRDRLETVK
jgi:hypothetical protein